MDFTTFKVYPIRISGLDENYNDELNAIEAAVIDEMSYSGAAEDVESLLPYFVFCKFCEARSTAVAAMTGESVSVRDGSMPSVYTQVQVWNLAVDKLNAILSNGETASEKYTSKISLLW